VSKHRNKNHQDQKSANDDGKPSYHHDIKWPSVYPVTIEPTPENTERYSNENEYRRSQRRIGIWMNAITGVAAVVGLLGLIVLYYTLKVTGQSADAQTAATKIADMNRRIEERAYVSVDLSAVDFNKSLGESHVFLGTIGLTIPLINWGKTIAQVDARNAHLIIQKATDPEPTIPNTGDQIIPGMNLIPGNTGARFTARTEAKYTTADLAKLQRLVNDGTYRLYTYGRISYVTIFGDVKQTEFCDWVFPPGHSWNPCVNSGKRMD
jgi:hypothetical protein